MEGKTYGYTTRYCSFCGMKADKVEEAIVFCEYCGAEIT